MSAKPPADPTGDPGADTPVLVPAHPPFRTARTATTSEPGPIFIVGNGRSGTTIMLQSISRTLDWPAYGEGHLHPLFHRLRHATQRFYNSGRTKHLGKSPSHMVHHVAIDEIEAHLGRMARDIFDRVYGTAQFVDKTPGPQGVLSLQILQRAYPTMRVINMKRRGIEVVRSSVKKFPRDSFETHCQLWSAAVSNFNRIADQLTVPYLEIDQYDLAREPDRIADRLQDFLGLDRAQRGALLQRFRDNRPQSSGELNAGEVSIADSWNEAEIAIFRETCATTMLRNGWSEDADYFLPDDYVVEEEAELADVAAEDLPETKDVTEAAVPSEPMPEVETEPAPVAKVPAAAPPVQPANDATATPVARSLGPLD